MSGSREGVRNKERKKRSRNVVGIKADVTHTFTHEHNANADHKNFLHNMHHVLHDYGCLCVCCAVLCSLDADHFHCHPISISISSWRFIAAQEVTHRQCCCYATVGKNALPLSLP